MTKIQIQRLMQEFMSLSYIEDRDTISVHEKYDCDDDCLGHNYDIFKTNKTQNVFLFTSMQESKLLQGLWHTEL